MPKTLTSNKSQLSDNESLYLKDRQAVYAELLSKGTTAQNFKIEEISSNEDEPEVVIINYIIKTLTQGRNVTALSHNTSELVVKAAKEIALRIMASIKTSIEKSEDSEPFDEVFLRAEIYKHLRALQEEEALFISREVTTKIAEEGYRHTDLLRNLIDDTLFLTVERIKTSIDDVNTVISNFSTETLSTRLWNLESKIKSANITVTENSLVYNKYLEAINKNIEVTKDSLSEDFKSGDSESDVLEAGISLDGLEDNKADLFDIPQVNTDDGLSPQETSTNSTSIFDNQNVYVQNLIKLRNFNLSVFKYLDKTGARISDTSSKIHALSVKHLTDSGISRFIARAADIGDGPRKSVMARISTAGEEAKLGGGFTALGGWLIAVGAFAALMLLLTDSILVASARVITFAVGLTHITRAIKNRLGSAVMPLLKSIQRKLFFNQGWLGRINRHILKINLGHKPGTAVSRWILRRFGIKAMSSEAQAARISARALRASGGSGSVQAVPRVSSVGVVLSVGAALFEGYAFYQLDPTEMSARARNMSVDEYKKAVQEGKIGENDRLARVANIISGGERGFINAIMRGVSFMWIGLSFTTLGGLIGFVLGVLLNLIGPEIFLKIGLKMQSLFNTYILPILSKIRALRAVRDAFIGDTEKRAKRLTIRFMIKFLGEDLSEPLEELKKYVQIAIVHQKRLMGVFNRMQIELVNPVNRLSLYLRNSNTQSHIKELYKAAAEDYNNLIIKPLSDAYEKYKTADKYSALDNTISSINKDLVNTKHNLTELFKSANLEYKDPTTKVSLREYIVVLSEDLRNISQLSAYIRTEPTAKAADLAPAELNLTPKPLGGRRITFNAAENFAYQVAAT